MRQLHTAHGRCLRGRSGRRLATPSRRYPWPCPRTRQPRARAGQPPCGHSERQCRAACGRRGWERLSPSTRCWCPLGAGVAGLCRCGSRERTATSLAGGAPTSPRCPRRRRAGGVSSGQSPSDTSS
eukprot:scaffold18292_cov60-Phaeocystis_antarctica.AAC.5